MINLTAPITDAGLSLGSASEAAPDHAGIPFINGFPLPLEESIAGLLDCEQVIDLATAKESPLKENATIRKTAIIWCEKHPEEYSVVKAKKETERRREAIIWGALTLGTADIGLITGCVVLIFFPLTFAAISIIVIPWLFFSAVLIRFLRCPNVS